MDSRCVSRFFRVSKSSKMASLPYSAYKFFDYCRLPVSGVHIRIDKTIPTQAGLAGGSSDGAAVIVGLNQLFNTKLSPKEIGVGLYYVMPVMFVDFTEAWRLPRNARTKINLGGITMQLAFGILLTGLFALCKERGFPTPSKLFSKH